METTRSNKIVAFSTAVAIAYCVCPSFCLSFSAVLNLVSAQARSQTLKQAIKNRLFLDKSEFIPISGY
jgi:hypothetical protein